MSAKLTAVADIVTRTLGRPPALETAFGLVSHPTGLDGAGRVFIRPGADADRVDVDLELATLPGTSAVVDVSALSDPSAPPVIRFEQAGGSVVVHALLEIGPGDLDPVREITLSTRITGLLGAAARLAAPAVDPAPHDALHPPLSEFLCDVAPWPMDLAPDPKLSALTDEVFRFLEGQCNVAVVASEPEITRALLAHVSAALQQRSIGLQMPTTTSLLVPDVLNLVAGATGVLTVPAVSIRTASGQLYELPDEVERLEASLGQMSRSILFTGTREQLQTLFNRGQGRPDDPLNPVVLEAEVSDVSGLATWLCRQLTGQADPSVERRLRASVERVLPSIEPAKRVRTVSRMVLPTALAAMQPGGDPFAVAREMLDRVKTARATLGGLGEALAQRRSPEMLAHLHSKLSGTGLRDALSAEILGQDRAIDELVATLRAEVLGQRPNRPIALCLVGTSGVGKSATARILARHLGVRHENFDASSCSSIEFTTSQLLGSAPGYVGSYQPGRLERAAREEGGVVLEVSDLDHSTIRRELGDIFLQGLGEGYFQSASGKCFGVPNVIFVFTTNLPDGADERMHRGGLGFGTARAADRDLSTIAAGHLSDLLSPALIGRLGRPVVYDMMTPTTVARIAESAVRDTVQVVAQNLGLQVGAVMLEDGLGGAIATPRARAAGARAIADEARRATTAAMLRCGLVGNTHAVRISFIEGDGLTVRPIRSSGNHSEV